MGDKADKFDISDDGDSRVELLFDGCNEVNSRVEDEVRSWGSVDECGFLYLSKVVTGEYAADKCEG